MVGREPDMQVVGSAATGEEALACSRETDPTSR